MVKPELLTYMKQVMDLETALYANQRLDDGFTNEKLSASIPAPPPKPQREIEKPIRPTAPGISKHQGIKTGVLCIFGITMFFLGIHSFPKIQGFDDLLGVAALVLIGSSLALSGIIGVRENKDDEAAYAKAMQRYNIEIEEYEKSEAAYREHEKSYQAEMESYDERVAAYKSRCTKTIDEIFRVRHELEYALITFYHQNIIYPKYRNFVAVTTIYEYLASGRCDTLEGADGAYNLYEMELRQNIIIGQLSSVLDSLEQIKNNQFTLYKEITEANQKSADLLSDISNNTKFSAYANKEIAKVNRIIAQNTEATKYYTLFNAAKRK